VLTDIMAQKDPRDATSKTHPDKKSRFQSLSDYDLKGKKVALPREFM
jgi:Asp-tRNA(Asn)/Glu-tRNA(Gln) amidotransferase A subunit family amidase